ncbi:hypothetical protein [Winogradskyella vincentii]|uniref:DUF3995 domain-containing protein n=1 Tax=Winogradskyella vincentii TaxID=2877122 RepID=A0ABS7XZS2_9FLAO|nr:hypothetical protein [Winogradskyella vincentii]MCA0153153.1 hypothetical protein [Winogradskyella vincentii]
MWRYIIAWFPMIIIAIANGLFREKVIRNKLNELQAHQISTATMIVLFGIYVWVLFKILNPSSEIQAIKIGLLWLVLTIIFEFTFGHYVAGHSWNRLFQDYNIFQGRVWVLVLIWITIAPYIIYQLQK